MAPSEAVYLCNVVEKTHQYFRPKMRTRSLSTVGARYLPVSTLYYNLLIHTVEVRPLYLSSGILTIYFPGSLILDIWPYWPLILMSCPLIF